METYAVSDGVQVAFSVLTRGTFIPHWDELLYCAPLEIPIFRSQLQLIL